MRWCGCGSGAVFVIFAAASVASARGDTPVQGRFLVRYQPIYCRMAPCGPGSYAVEVNGRRIGWVKRVVVDASTPAAPRSFIAGFVWGNEPLAVEGSATISGDRVTLHAERAIEGEWKP